MLQACGFPDCGTLTLGGFCLTHEAPRERAPFPRGRPFPSGERRVSYEFARAAVLAPIAILGSEPPSAAPGPGYAVEASGRMGGRFE